MAKTFGVTFAVGARLNPSVASVFSTVQEKVKAAAGQMRELTAKAKALETAEAAKNRLMETQKLYAAGGGRDPMLAEALKTQVAAYQQAAAEAKKYGIAVGDIAREHKRTEIALAATQRRLESLQKAEAFKARRHEAAESFRAAAVPAIALAAPIRDAIKFESAMASAAKTIDGMRDENGRLTAQYYAMEAAIKQMGQTLPLTHDELAKLFAAGGQQGLSAVDDLREFTTLSAQMAVAFDMSTEAAAEAIGGYRTALNLTMPEARNLLDLMNQYANTTSASEKGIADVVRRIGSLGSIGGVAAKPVTALAATLDAMKVAPEVAATGIKNLILAMTAGTAATKGQKAAFASLGIDTVKLAKQMQVDGPAAIISVLEAVKKLPKASQLSTMQQIFGKESLGSIAPLLANLDKVRANLVICADQTRYAGAMQQEFDNVSGTTANKLILLKNRVQEVGITIAGALLPAVQSITETIGPPISAVAKFAGEHKTLTTVAVGTAASLVGLKIGIAAVAWTASGIGGAFNLAKAAMVGFAVVSKGAAAAQTVFNVAMAANPVGIVVTAVAALGAGLVFLYKTCEPVRAFFDRTFGFIGEKLAWVAAKFEPVKAGIKTVASWVGLGGNDEDEPRAPEPAAFETLQDANGMTLARTAAMPQSAEQAPMVQPVEPQPVKADGQAVVPTARAVAQPQAKAAIKTQEPVAPQAAQIAVSQTVAQPAPPAVSQTPLQAPARPAAQPIRTAGQEQQQPEPKQQLPELSQSTKPDMDAILKQMAAMQAPAKKQQPQNQPAQPQIIQPQVQVAVNITQNGIPDQTFATGVMNAIRARQTELETMISSIVNDQARLAYG